MSIVEAPANRLTREGSPRGKLGPSDGAVRSPWSAARPPAPEGAAKGKSPETAARALRQIIDDLGIATEDALAALAAARCNGSDIAAELIAAGHCSAEDYAGAAARWLGLPLDAPKRADRTVSHGTPDPNPVAAALRTCDTYLKTKIFLTPKLESLAGLKAGLERNPALAKHCRVTTRRSLRDHALAERSVELSEAARLSLSSNDLGNSARNVATGWQGWALGSGFVGFLWLLSLFPEETITAVHLAASLGFSAWLMMRFAAAFGRHDEVPAERVAEDERPPPIYTVVVALHHEHDVVGKLVDNLDRLDWPKSRIEIFLVCEADDPRTILACRRAVGGKPQFSIIAVPPSQPRTKPKALNYVLPITEGEYLVLYDAEDDPHPQQLREAWARFDDGPDDLACLQAPLVIRNGGRTWLTAIFAMEYAALFRAFLPWLARHDLPIPLGGTSNHFRLAVLREIGGWDSHNVTEDADLGMRLTRRGYRIKTLRSPTLEDAPEIRSIWLPQRTRWLKGWIQTYLVHMRDPAKLWRELGPKRFAAFHLIFHGMVTSALLLPFAVLLATYTLICFMRVGWRIDPSDWLFLLDCSILLGGAVSFLCLAARGLDRSELREIAGAVVAVPIYWLMVSHAAYRALFKLYGDAHAWEKTPHGLVSRADMSDPCHRIDPVFDVS